MHGNRKTHATYWCPAGYVHYIALDGRADAQ